MTPQLELVVERDEDAVAARASATLAERAVSAVDRHGEFTMALSGGRAPQAMLEAPQSDGVPWVAVQAWQVDERVAPRGHADRNLGRLEPPLRARGVAVHAMPVDDPDLDAAADAYAQGLPGAFDLVHLGIGADGHTASLVPGDPVLEVDDRDVAITAPYLGRIRMTLTFRVLDRAADALWVVTGLDKAEAVRRLIRRDRSIPAGRVSTRRQVVVCDRAAASLLDSRA